MPKGAPVTSAEAAQALLYNEFIVYDTAQIRMRYLVECEFSMKW